MASQQWSNNSSPGYNPNRTIDLFALTTDGYIIAQDIDCQYEYVEMQQCSNCGGALVPTAQINRAFQGLNEIVAVCTHCGERYSFIFDISNDVYQTWWVTIQGRNYRRPFDIPPRVADPNQRYFTEE